MQKTGNLKKLLLRALSVILVCALVIALLSSCVIFRREILSKDELYANVAEEGREWSSVARYLYEWGFPTFNDDKFLAIEGLIDTYYYEDVPSNRDLAVLTANYFLEYYYDEINLKSVGAVTDALLYCYVAALGDPYSSYKSIADFAAFDKELSGNGSFVGIGIQIRKTDEGYPYVTSVHRGSAAEAAGVSHGDVILGVDGIRITTGLDSNYQQVVDMIPGEAGTTVTLTVLRAGEEVQIISSRAVLKETTVNYRFDSNTAYAYIEILSFKDTTAAEFKAAVDLAEQSEARGIVFDVRNNLGGKLSAVTQMLSYLVTDGQPIVSYKYKGKSPELIKTAPDGHAVSVPVVVITNGLTASAAEIFAAALKDYREMGLVDVTVVGEKSYGKGVMQSTFAIADGSAVTVTVAYYDPPISKNYHGEGVKPDVEEKDSITVGGGDALLKAAENAMNAYFDSAAAA